MSAYPNLPVRFLVNHHAEAPTPPSCPDYGFPSVPPSKRNRCAQPWIATYDAPCTPEAIECLLFRRRHYEWRKSRLVALLHRRPDASASATAKYDWCVELVRTGIDMADDTNVATPFLSGFGVEHHFNHTLAHLRTIRPSLNARPVPLMYPELWFTGRGDESVPPFQSVLGHYVLGHLEHVDRARSAYLVMPVGRSTSIMAEHVRAAHALERPRPFPRRWHVTSASSTPASDRAALRAANAQGRNVSARDLSVALFTSAPTGYLVGSVERATGGAPCLAGPADRECFHYERFPIAIAGAEPTMDLLAAHARDWINAPFDVVVNRGYRRYLKYLHPYAERGLLGLTPEELLEQTLRAEREEAKTWSRTAFGAVGAIVGAVNPVFGAIIALVAAAIDLLLELMPLAHGDGDCPRLGFRRMLTDPECAVPTPQGSVNIAGKLNEYMERVAFRPVTAGAGQPEDEPRAPDEGGVPVVPLVGAAALVALGLAALAKRRSDSKKDTAEKRTANGDRS